MSDLKFVSLEKSKLYSEADDYFSFAAKVVIEMQKRRGLLIRHLVLPNNQSDTKEIIDFITDNIYCDTYLNLKEQYHTCYMSNNFTLIKDWISEKEYDLYIVYAKDKGFNRPEYIFR